MARLVSENTAKEIRQTINTVNDLTVNPSSRLRRRVRTKGGGSSLYYVEITSSTNFSTYTVTIFDNPTDRVTVESGVTAYAKMHSAGTLPNSTAGKGLWAIKGNDGKYYIINYSVAHG